jgi:hypothetical protein
MTSSVMRLRTVVRSPALLAESQISTNSRYGTLVICHRNFFHGIIKVGERLAFGVHHLEASRQHRRSVIARAHSRNPRRQAGRRGFPCSREADYAGPSAGSVVGFLRKPSLGIMESLGTQILWKPRCPSNRRGFHAFSRRGADARKPQRVS